MSAVGCRNAAQSLGRARACRDALVDNHYDMMLAGADVFGQLHGDHSFFWNVDGEINRLHVIPQSIFYSDTAKRTGTYDFSRSLSRRRDDFRLGCSSTTT
jgi:hypothetical protein